MFWTLLISRFSILTMNRRKLGSFQFFIFPKISYFQFNSLLLFWRLLDIISQFIYFTLKRAFLYLWTFMRRLLLILTLRFLKFLDRVLNPLFEGFVINQYFVLNASKPLDNHSEVFTFKLTFIEQFQNIIKLIPCDIPIVIFINLFNREHHLVHLIIFSDDFDKVFFRNWSELILGSIVLSVTIVAIHVIRLIFIIV